MNDLDKMIRRADAKTVRRMRKGSRRSFVRAYRGKQRKALRTLVTLTEKVID